MRNLLNVRSVAIAAILLLTATPSALAQDNTFTYTCEMFGVPAPEPLGDRENHSLSVGQPSMPGWTESVSGPHDPSPETGDATWLGG
jgi:hypothetical protein